MQCCIIVCMPELQEGLESYPVCIIDGDKVKEVEEIVKRKGLGVQGTEDGIDIRLTTVADFQKWTWPHKPLYIDLETFRKGIEKNEINWHKIIGWQRWGQGTVFQKEKIIKIKKSSEDELSSLWKELGYEIVVLPDNYF